MPVFEFTGWRDRGSSSLFEIVAGSATVFSKGLISMIATGAFRISSVKGFWVKVPRVLGLPDVARVLGFALVARSTPPTGFRVFLMPGTLERA